MTKDRLADNNNLNSLFNLYLEKTAFLLLLSAKLSYLKIDSLIYRTAVVLT